MAPDKQELARRAVACKGWRWMPGMRAIQQGSLVAGRELEGSNGLAAPFVLRQGETTAMDIYRRVDGSTRDIPDLDDPATLGCLLAIVREAWGEVVDLEEYYTRQGCEPGERRREFAVTVHCIDTIVFDGGSLGEALVAALEAAP